MPKTPEKTKARLPRGFADRSADDIRATEKMMATIRGVFELYGFEPVDQPLIEYTDALGKFLPDQDRPNEGVFSFQDEDAQEARSGEAARGKQQEARSGEAATGKKGEWLSLRYDLTAPMARFVAENYERLPKPFRSYRSGWVFRNEKPGPGRFRQFMQFDADTVGTPGVAADAEMAMMMADVLEALGLYELQPDGSKKPLYVIRVNNRKVLDGVMEAIGLGGDENAGQRLTVLRVMDKADKFPRSEIKKLLTIGRMDESGDETKGAGLDLTQAETVLRLFTNVGQIERAVRFFGAVWTKPFTIKKYSQYVKMLLSADYIPDGVLSGFRELEQIRRFVRAAGYGPDRIRIDPSVVRGLEYYTGPVYEAELLAEIPNEDGKIVRFGSVGGGGRYDGLVSRFRGEPVPATGFSVGVSRLMTALKNLGKLDVSEVVAPVVVLVMDRDTESLGRYQRMVSQLRQAGIRAEMYLGGAGMKAQLKYADRRGSPVAIIQGADERARGEIQVKDLIAGASEAKAIAGHAEYKEARPGQVTVAETELVATVRRILDAQSAERSS